MKWVEKIRERKEVKKLITKFERDITNNKDNLIANIEKMFDDGDFTSWQIFGDQNEKTEVKLKYTFEAKEVVDNVAFDRAFISVSTQNEVCLPKLVIEKISEISISFDDYIKKNLQRKQPFINLISKVGCIEIEMHRKVKDLLEKPIVYRRGYIYILPVYWKINNVHRLGWGVAVLSGKDNASSIKKFEMNLVATRFPNFRDNSLGWSLNSEELLYQVTFLIKNYINPSRTYNLKNSINCHKPFSSNEYYNNLITKTD